MGGRDKGLVTFRDRPLVAWVIEALRPQVAALVINANRNQEAYEALRLPRHRRRDWRLSGPAGGLRQRHGGGLDPVDRHRRPATGLSWRWTWWSGCVRPCVRDGAEIAVATDGVRMQPVYALVPVALAPSLQAFLAAGDRKIDLWYARHRVALADLGDRPESFANINSEGDVALLQEETAP